MRGRKPKALKVKLATGNPGKRKLNLDEPKFPDGVGSAPTILDKLAKAEWTRLVKLFEPHGVLKNTDRGILSLYCTAYSTWWRARTGIANEGGEVLSDADGDLYPNPWVRIAAQAAAEMARFGSMLGLDPTTRTRLIADANASMPLTPHTVTRPRTKVDRLPLPT